MIVRASITSSAMLISEGVDRRNVLGCSGTVLPPFGDGDHHAFEQLVEDDLQFKAQFPDPLVQFLRRG